MLDGDSMSDQKQNDFQKTDIQNVPMVVYCSRERLKKASRFGPVIRRFIVVECNEVGHGGIIINGKEFSFGPGRCYVLLPGDTVMQLCDGDDPRGGIYCILDAPQLVMYLKEAGVSSENPFLPDALFGEVHRWVEKMIEDFACHDAGTPMRQAGNIYGLLGALLRSKPAAKSDAIEKVIGMMDANYPEPLSVEQLARMVGLERTYFSSLFKAKTGYSPYQYLTALRIQKACLLLKDTQLSISDVAELVGLDARNFARLFKKETGKTPLSYRKRPPKA